MEVAASLPNIMKIFPLKIMVRESFPLFEQDAFHGEAAAAAANIDEEMEEGEIDTREFTLSSGNQEVLSSAAVPSAAQHSCAHRLPCLLSVTDDMQLEQSVDALLLLPDKVSPEVQSRFCTNDTLSQFSLLSQPERHFHNSPQVKKPDGFSLLKPSQKSSPVSSRNACSSPQIKEAPPSNHFQLPLPLKVFKDSKPNSLESKQTQSPPLCASSPSRRPNTCLPAKLLPLSPPVQRAEDSSPSYKKLKASSPPTNQPQTSLTVATRERQAHFKQRLSLVEQCLDPAPGEHPLREPPPADIYAHSPAEFELPTLSLERPQQHHAQSDLIFKDVPTFSQLDSVACIAPSKVPHGVKCTAVREVKTPPRPACLEASIEQEHSQPQLVGREPSTQTFSLQGHHHQSAPYLPYTQPSAHENQKLVLSGFSGAQNSLHVATSDASGRVDERAFITCANGKSRSRSSAVRDYPEGCGSNISAIANQVLVGRASSHDKVTLLEPVVNERPLSGSLLEDKRIVGPLKGRNTIRNTPRNLQRSVSRTENQTALCLNKSPNASVLPLKRQNAHLSFARKCENRKLPGYSLGTAQKKSRIRPALSHILCQGMERPPPSIEEKHSEFQWFLEDELLGYDHPINAVRTVKRHRRPRLPKPLVSSKSLPQNVEVLEKMLPFGIDSGASSRSQVKRTLQEFDCVRRSLAMTKDRHARPDLAAAQILREKGRWRNHGREKIIGDVPGVEVGDQFSFRIEMLIVGLHRQVQGGIDYISGSVRLKGPLATSIVASGGYEDDDDCGATFIYTGQGGNNYKGDRRQGRDQVLQRGNLALSNSFKDKTPVRVIRGSTDDKFYTYDGLYDVIDCWFQTGVAGFGVYQYKLSRRPGQPELISSIVKFMGSVKERGLARPHLVLGDLSRGKERLPVSVVNEVDEAAPPQFFTYIPKMKYPSWYHPELSRGCDCVGGCVDASKCLCAAKNGGEFPYNEIGQIVIDKKFVFECGKSCACPSSCHNRVSQKGLKHQLEVFKTKNRGWGVRSLEPIRPGDFICEYAGELLSDADAEQRTECDEYLFDIGHKTNSWIDVSDLMDSSSKGTAIVPFVQDAGFTIDARLFGNVARFINHSCWPNLYAQDVIYDSDDLRFPHVMLFAMENIPPLREFSYDYNYTIGHVRDANGDVKRKACYCGAQDCRGRLY